MFLTFDTLLSNYLHISNIRKLHKKNYNLYKIVNNSYIINIMYISSNLYKLYKLLFSLTLKKYYITIINTTHLNNNNNLIAHLIKFTKSTCFNRQWINGLLTNEDILSSFIITYTFLCGLNNSDNYLLKTKFKNLHSKYSFSKYLKNIEFSKFIFFINLDSNISAVKESIFKNKFIMGLHDLNFDTNFIDFGLCCNNTNPKSINFILKFITTSLIAAQSVKFVKLKKNKSKNK
uniref:Ribosomal protein S2 n=1 Tax=Babesia motasi TaxID=237580 RepID=A0A411ADF9_9APIC|nr:ribosomal protein S2 [Babesia motasi]QAX27144.1 ribosomal protein S2 [Babesia motasi]